MFQDLYFTHHLFFSGTNHAPSSNPAPSPVSQPSTSSRASNPPRAQGDLFTNMVSEKSFYDKLEAQRTHVLKYESKSAQAKALSVVPHEALRAKAKAKFDQIKAKGESGVKDELLQDLLLLETLDWFKNDFFKWVDAPTCEKCGTKTKPTGMLLPTAEEQRDGAGRVEG